MMISFSSQRPTSVVLATFFCLLVIVQIFNIRETLWSRTSRRVSIPRSSTSFESVADFTAAQKNPTLPPSLEEAPVVFPEGGGEGGSRIRQCTSIWPGDDRPHFERALNTHIQHGAKWGYPTDVLRHFLVESKAHNKVAYILYLVLKEMAKPRGTRAEWIFWFDADTIILNPFISLETFLPPADFGNIHFLAAKDNNGLNAGVLFIRVHKSSVNMLAEVLAEPLLKPDLERPFAEQTDLARVLSRPKYRDNTLYQPRWWYNAYSKGDHDPIDPEVHVGDFQVHFPGVDPKEKYMGFWLDLITPKNDWALPAGDTVYPEALKGYWGLMRVARDLLGKVEKAVKDADNDVTRIFALQIGQDNLQKLVREEAYGLQRITLAIQALAKALDPTSQKVAPVYAAAAKPPEILTASG